MDKVMVSLTLSELTLLVRMLERARGEAKVELHHTHFSPSYREDVKEEVELMDGLLDRLRQTIPKG